MTSLATDQPTASAPTVAELRHKAEVPMLIFAGLLTLLGVVVVVVAMTTGGDVPAWAGLAAAGLILPFGAVVYIRVLYWKEITSGVEVTAKQLPELHAIHVDLATRMEMSPIPRLYIRNGNGALNAFAAKCTVKSNYVMVYSDLVDIAYRNNDMEGIRFVIAHELGHIKCGHTSLWRLGISTMPTKLKIGASVSRAQEYTADRCAAYYAPEGARSMMVLVAGKNMYPHCDLDAYLESIDDHKDGFWMKFSNFLADHAVGFRRIPPLANIEEDGWDQHGKML